jgi:F420-non-reducing hydrogenase iron-sulfur subunit
MSYEPKIVGFLCNWCSYAGADLAGVSRFQYPTNLRVIRVMCSGRVHPAHILEAFKNGADGVLVAGCHPPNDCHYISGNLKAKRRVAMLKKLMEQMGMDPERLRLERVSAAEGEKFARVVTEFTNTLREKGPCQLKAVLAQEAD